MKKIIKEGTKQNIICENCGCLFSFEKEDIYHNEITFNECKKVTGMKAGYKTYVTCPQCENEIVLKQRGRIMSTMEYLQILYFTLRQMKEQNREYFRDSKYKWVLGAAVIQELKLRDPYRLAEADPLYLFGIVVEVDYVNPRNVQLFEDITNKIAIKVED